MADEVNCSRNGRIDELLRVEPLGEGIELGGLTQPETLRV